MNRFTDAVHLQEVQATKNQTENGKDNGRLKIKRVLGCSILMRQSDELEVIVTFKRHFQRNMRPPASDASSLEHTPQDSD